MLSRVSEVILEGSSFYEGTHKGVERIAQGASFDEYCAKQKVILGMLTKAQAWSVRHKGDNVRGVIEGLQLLSDVVGKYNELTFRQTALMYFMGLWRANPKSSQGKLALRVLEVLDISPCFNAVYPVSRFGLSHSLCEYEKLEVE